MGGSMSEPATLVNISESTRLAYTLPLDHEPTGWARSDAAMSELVQGIQHVDDALLLSLVYCYECLHAGLARCWPSDCGTTLEEHGSSVRFLQAVVHIQGDTGIVVRPFVVNRDACVRAHSGARLGHIAAPRWLGYTPY